MLSYETPEATTRLLKNISELTAEMRRFLDTLSEDHREAMQRYARVSIIGSTTRIENAVLTDPAIEWIDDTLSRDGRPTAFIKEKEYIENKLSKERERSIEEVAGCRSMLAIIYTQSDEMFPLGTATIKGLHHELLQYYPPASYYLGKYKVVPNSVIETVKGTDIRKDVLKTADPGPITDAAMRDLVDWYNATLPEHPWPIAVAAEFVFRFLAIHPFQDGNGRLGRALFTLALLQSRDAHLKAVAPFLALDRHIEKTKEEYYLVLRKCSEGQFSQDPTQYHIGYFLTYLLKRMNEALNNDIPYYAHKYSAYISLAEAPQKVLACFKEQPETKLGLGEVLQHVTIPKRTAIHALTSLVREGFLQKTGRGPARKYMLAF